MRTPALKRRKTGFRARMMKTIWKYTINRIGLTRLILPNDAQILSCGLDGFGAPCIWAEVDPETSFTEMRYIYGIGTGMSIEERPGYARHFIGSIKEDDYIWHIYEYKEIV